MSGGGNYVLLRQDDGVETLYAHFITGTVPAGVCPHNQTLFSKPDDETATEVPEAQRARIRRGQLLGRAGNSGNSTNPHLHIHSEKASQPVPMRFAGGLAAPISNDKADPGPWTRFAGQSIPPGPVLVWPPLKKGEEYARHGLPVSDFQREFDHLADSGYAPEWLDGYSVRGNAYCNMVWRPARRPWVAFFGISPEHYQAESNRAVADGLAPTLVESFLDDGKARYAVIFEKLPGVFVARHGLTTAQHDQELKAAEKAGLSPVSVSVVSIGGDRRYTVLYRKDPIGSWQLKSQLSEGEYQKAVDENKAAGRHPVYLNAYQHEGKTCLAVIFASEPRGAWGARHGLGASEYQAEWESARKQGLLTRTVTGYDGASRHIFAAAWMR
jgi:hypothetical protein